MSKTMFGQSSSSTQTFNTELLDRKKSKLDFTQTGQKNVNENTNIDISTFCKTRTTFEEPLKIDSNLKKMNESSFHRMDYMPLKISIIPTVEMKNNNKIPT